MPPSITTVAARYAQVRQPRGPKKTYAAVTGTIRPR